MRSLLCGAHGCLIALMVAGLVVLPAQASATPFVGVIVSCNNARLSGMNAVQGVNVYAGDTLETGDLGALRLAVGLSQVDLMGPTLVKVSQDSGAVRATVQRGTIDFSAGQGQLEIETPLGIVRGEGAGRASGEVTVLGANQIAVYAWGSKLNLVTNDGTHTIASGTAYRFVAEPADDQGPQGTYPLTVKKRHKKRKIAAFIIVGGAALGAFAIWNALTVSPTTLSTATQ